MLVKLLNVYVCMGLGYVTNKRVCDYHEGL